MLIGNFEIMKHKILLGAIAGDVIGSVYEFNHVLWKDFDLFQSYSKYTDDTVMTVANADWIGFPIEPEYTVLALFGENFDPSMLITAIITMVATISANYAHP